MNESQYTFGTASLEILILLAVAFILGALLCYVLKAQGWCCRQREEMDEEEESAFHLSLDTQSMTIPPPPHKSTQIPAGLSGGSMTYEADLGSLLRGRSAPETPSSSRAASVSPTRPAPASTAEQPFARETRAKPPESSASEPRLSPFERRAAAIASAPPSSGRFLDSSTPVDIEPAHNLFLDMPSEDQEDDLGILDGITEAAKEVLHQAGIKSFAKLATMDRDDLRSLLDANGDFSAYEPKSWPYQAELAAKQNWDRLREYQDFLRAGRR
ncbi:MAG: hypothetical protein CR991_00285 [Proteobacteria bacterium]|nr:MAG: hypothetical protein CR991_00285 [Pseudomonadota bacterium]